MYTDQKYQCVSLLPFQGTTSKKGGTLTDLPSDQWQSTLLLPLRLCWPDFSAFQTVYVFVEVPYPLLHRDFVVVSDGVFSEEVKLNHVFLAIQFRMQLDMFYSQRAAAHGVSCLSFFFFISSSQSKLHLHQDKWGKHFGLSQSWIDTRNFQTWVYKSGVPTVEEREICFWRDKTKFSETP